MRSNPFAKPEIVDCSGFPVPKYGSLLQHEMDWLDERKLEQVTAYMPVLRLAKEIAEQESITGAEAIALLESMGSTSADAEAQSILVKYADRLNCIIAAQEPQKAISIGSATLMLQRIPFEWMSEHEEDLWQSFKVSLPVDGSCWTIDCTRHLPRHIINELNGLFQNEFNQWETFEIGSLDLGEASQNLSNTSPPPEPTGKRSTTKSRHQGTQTLASTGSDSDIAQ